MPSFHPPEPLLMDYAAGALPEAVSLMVATHLSYCPECQAEVRRLEAVGGALLEALPPTPVSTGLDAIFAKLDAPPPPPARLAGEAWMPRPLRRALAALPDAPALPWQRVTASLSEIRLPIDAPPGSRTRLMRIKAGQAMPEHTHGGTEYVLVLKGGFTDSSGHFLPGDLAISTDAHVHRPKADDDTDCLCLAVVDGSLKLTGPLGWVVNRFLQF